MATLIRSAGSLALHHSQQQYAQQQLFAVRITGPALHSYNSRRDKSSYKCVVLGGGAGGCAMASKMARKFGAGKVAVVEPHDVSILGDAVMAQYAYIIEVTKLQNY